MQVFEAPRGRGPYGITVTLDGTVFSEMERSYAEVISGLVPHVTKVYNVLRIVPFLS